MKGLLVILFLFFLAKLSLAQQQGNLKIPIKEVIGIDSVVVIGEEKKSIKSKYGRSDSFLYTKYRKMAVSHPFNKRSAKTVIVKKVGRPSDTYYYKKLELYIHFGKNDLVDYIYFNSDKYQTKKGLSIGDTRTKANKLYREGGSPILECPKEGVDIIFDCDIVKEIKIYKPY